MNNNDHNQNASSAKTTPRLTPQPSETNRNSNAKNTNEYQMLDDGSDNNSAARGRGCCCSVSPEHNALSCSSPSSYNDGMALMAAATSSTTTSGVMMREFEEDDDDEEPTSNTNNHNNNNNNKDDDSAAMKSTAAVSMIAMPPHSSSSPSQTQGLAALVKVESEVLTNKNDDSRRLRQEEPPAAAAAAADGIIEDASSIISYWAASKEIIPFASYATLYMSLTMVMTVLPLGFIGNQLGEEMLAGASVGYFLLCIFAVYPTMAMMNGLDTLCSQEYGRDPNSDVQGLLLQRGLIVGLGFLGSVCLIFYIFLEDLLLGFYKIETQERAKAYLRYAPLFLIPLNCYTAFAKFNSNQQLPHVPLIATAVGLVVLIGLLLAFVQQGLEAVMLCIAVCFWVQLAVIVAYTYLSPVTRKTLGSLRLREAAFQWEGGVKTYLRIAVPATIFISAETSGFDLSSLLAAGVSEASGSAWSALLSYELVFICFATGFSAAACAKVGAAIGANQPTNAKTYAWTSLGLSVLVAVAVNAPFMYFCFDYLVTLFGGNLEEASKLRFLFPLLYCIDTVQMTFQGIFGGANMNDLGAKLLIVGMWGIGVPSAVFLSMGGWPKVVELFENSHLTYPLWGTIFVDPNNWNPSAHFFWGSFASVGSFIRNDLSGLVGVAVGILLGISFLSPSMVYCLTRMDWVAITKKAAAEGGATDNSNTGGNNLASTTSSSSTSASSFSDESLTNPKTTDHSATMMICSTATDTSASAKKTSRQQTISTEDLRCEATTSEEEHIIIH